MFQKLFTHFLGVSKTAIYLSQQMGFMEFNVSVHMVPLQQ